MGRYYDDNYIAHSTGPWKKHKYLNKIGSGANAVYVYAKDKISGAVDSAGHATGISQKKDLQNAASDYDSKHKASVAANKKFQANPNNPNNVKGVADAYHNSRVSHDKLKSAQKKYNKTPLGKVERTARNVKSFGKDVGDNLSYHATNAVSDAEWKLGVPQKRYYKTNKAKYKKAKQKYDKERKKGPIVTSKGTAIGYNSQKMKTLRAKNEMKGARDAMNYSKKDYEKTPLGKVDSAKRKATNSVNKFLSSTKKKANSTKKEFNKRLKNSKGKTNLKGAKKIGPHTYATFEEPKVAPKGKATSQSYSDYEKQKKRQQTKKSSSKKTTIDLGGGKKATFEDAKLGKGKQVSQSYSDYEKQKKRQQAKKASKGKKTVRLGKHTYATFDEAKLK